MNWPAPPTIHRGVEWPQFSNSLFSVCSLFVLCKQISSLFIVQYSTVQYSTVRYSTVQYSTVKRSGHTVLRTFLLQYSTVRYIIVWYSTVQYSTVQYNTVQYITVQYSRYRPYCKFMLVTTVDNIQICYHATLDNIEIS